MKKFHITRINTLKGIFKITGHWQQTPDQMILTQLEVMSTDGWQVLELKHQEVVKLIKTIEQQIFSHLQAPDL